MAIGVAFGCAGCKGGKRTYREQALSDKAVNLAGELAADESVRAGNAGGFTENNLSFAAEFFRRSFDGGNTLVSPLSLSVALAMTANGAKGETLTEMENVLAHPWLC